jgi:hypothetical protein
MIQEEGFLGRQLLRHSRARIIKTEADWQAQKYFVFPMKGGRHC